MKNIAIIAALLVTVGLAACEKKPADPVVVDPVVVTPAPAPTTVVVTPAPEAPASEASK